MRRCESTSREQKDNYELRSSFYRKQRKIQMPPFARFLEVRRPSGSSRMFQPMGHKESTGHHPKQRKTTATLQPPPPPPQQQNTLPKPTKPFSSLKPADPTHSTPQAPPSSPRPRSSPTSDGARKSASALHSSLSRYPNIWLCFLGGPLGGHHFGGVLCPPTTIEGVAH